MVVSTWPTSKTHVAVDFCLMSTSAVEDMTGCNAPETQVTNWWVKLELKQGRKLSVSQAVEQAPSKY